MRLLACSAATAVALLALSPAVQASKSADPPQAGEPITLTFDWSKAFHSRVHHAMRMTQVSAGRRNRVEIDMSYELSATSTPNGLLIRTDNVETAVRMPDAPGGGNPLQKFMTRLTSNSPAYLVSNSGRFLRIHDLPGFRKNMIIALDEGIGAMMPAPVPVQLQTQLRQMISAMFTETTLHATASAEWNVYVGGWRDLRLKAGEVREFAVNAPVPMLGNAKVPMYGTVVMKGRTACRDGEPHRNCVALEMHVTTGEKEMAAAMQAFLQRIAPQGGMPPMRRIRQTRTVRIVCDPATLRPFTSDSLSETAVYGNDAAPTNATVREERMRYSY